MSAGQWPFNDQKVGGAVVLFIPEFQDNIGRFCTRNDGRQCDIISFCKFRQFCRESCSGDDGIYTGGTGGFDIGFIQLCNSHDVDGDHTVAAGDFFRFSDLLRQYTQICFFRMFRKIWIVITNLGG